jgi:hypothetical protein
VKPWGWVSCVRIFAPEFEELVVLVRDAASHEAATTHEGSRAHG